jgi:hypothetical protein
MDAMNLMKEEDALLTETVESGCNRVGFATVLRSRADPNQVRSLRELPLNQFPSI